MNEIEHALKKISKRHALKEEVRHISLRDETKDKLSINCRDLSTIN